jgi:hypothetical protein
MYVLQVDYLKIYQSLTNFYRNITSFSKNIKFVTLTLGPAQNSLEAGASRTFPRTRQCNDAVTNCARLQCGRELPSSSSALHSANAEQEKHRDRQYIYIQPGGDQVFQTPMMQSPLSHCRKFEEMICMV